jgi:hypothetical protein
VASLRLSHHTDAQSSLADQLHLHHSTPTRQCQKSTPVKDSRARGRSCVASVPLSTAANCPTAGDCRRGGAARRSRPPQGYPRRSDARGIWDLVDATLQGHMRIDTPGHRDYNRNVALGGGGASRCRGMRCCQSTDARCWRAQDAAGPAPESMWVGQRVFPTGCVAYPRQGTPRSVEARDARLSMEEVDR